MAFSQSDQKIYSRRQALKKELNRIVRILLDEYQPEKVILFGSLATGKIGEWSDIDLVIIKDTPLRFLDRLKEVILLTQPKVDIDLLIYTPEELNRAETGDYPFIKREILVKGKVIYCRA